MSEEQKRKCFHKVNVEDSLSSRPVLETPPLVGSKSQYQPKPTGCVQHISEHGARSLTVQQYVFILRYNEQGEGTKERTDGLAEK